MLVVLALVCSLHNPSVTTSPSQAVTVTSSSSSGNDYVTADGFSSDDSELLNPRGLTASQIHDFTKLRYWDDFGLLGAIRIFLLSLNKILRTIFNPDPSTTAVDLHMESGPWIWLIAILIVIWERTFSEGTVRIA
eukprot:c484_g1_i1.p1 GENE.c484_g1_i1~~c484_g1_i1.p1  ORF type:complete len:135 (-),score=40.66 c484_g1_i1:84-488(-)